MEEKPVEIRQVSEKEIWVGENRLYLGEDNILYETLYYWSVNCSDELQWTNETYHFTTKKPSIKYVDDDFNSSTPEWGINNFSSIQDAILAVSTYGTVYVYNGTYYEDNILLGYIGQDKTGCTLIAESQNAIIDTDYLDSSIFIYANDSTIDGFTIKHGDDAGIWVMADNVIIKNCNITMCNRGIYSKYNLGSDATNITIENNIIHNNIEDGIYFEDDSHDIQILNNNISENGDNGIKLMKTVHNILIRNNTFFNNAGDAAISMIDESNNITITQNNFTNNQNYAIYLVGEVPYDVTIFLNNFISNTNQIIDSGENQFNNSLYGNFWDVFYKSCDGAVDNDNDGIADSPFVIDENSQDNYPLMKPHSHQATTLHIGGEGLNNYSTIANAINASYWGDTIYIHNDNYSEGIIDIETKLKIQGEDKETTSINASNLDYVINLSASYIEVLELEIKGGLNYGIKSQNNHHVWIHDCIIKENVIGDGESAGIKIQNSQNNTLENLSIINNGATVDCNGIEFNNVHYSNILNNIISNNTKNGVYLAFSNNNNFVGNNFSENDESGILFDYDGNCFNDFSSNEFFGNQQAGIRINNGGEEDANNNTITDNIFQNNDYGIKIEGGGNPMNNWIYLNNFYGDNSEEGKDDSGTGDNYWNNGLYGNYWIDYHNESQGAWDNNTDGIIDSPFVIPGGAQAQDSYPLMNPWDGLPFVHAPHVTTNESLGISDTNATLCGYLKDDGNENCIIRFEYGTTINYGNTSNNQTKSAGQTFTTNIVNLTRGHLYHFRAYAINSYGSSTGNNSFFLTKPAETTNLKATVASSSKIKLVWTKGIGANNTYIIRKTGSFPSNRFDGTLIYNSTGTSYFDMNLSASTTYYYCAWSFIEWNSINQWSDSYSIITCITESNSGGGSSPLPSPIIPEEDEEKLTVKEQIEQLYNIILSENFSALDEDRDGINDTFYDPNGILQEERFVSLNGDASFLLSVNGDFDKLFIWDTESNNIFEVYHEIGVVFDTIIDSKNGTVMVNVSINKGGWVYFHINDNYRRYSDLNITAQDGRKISENMIWRNKKRVFVLDDPSVEYVFVFAKSKSKKFLFDVMLEFTSDSINIGESIHALITLINVGDPGLVNATILYSLYKGEELIWNESENLSILGQLAFNKKITSEGLSPGEYSLSIVHYYGDNQTASALDKFSIISKKSEWQFPIIFIVSPIILIISAILIWIFRGKIHSDKKYGYDKVSCEVDKKIAELEKCRGKFKIK